MSIDQSWVLAVLYCEMNAYIVPGRKFKSLYPALISLKRSERLQTKQNKTKQNKTKERESLNMEFGTLGL